MLNYILGFFSHDIGIDLGTANTQVLVLGKGIVISEPSVVAMHVKTKTVLAIGAEAKRMLGKTPASIQAIRPLRDGVISDFDTTEKMLSYFIRKVHETPSIFPKIPRPRVVVGVPSNITEVERRAVQDATRRSGAREVFLIEEPMAAALGANLPVEEPSGTMIVDIGGGTSEIAVISLGGIVVNKSIRVAGDKMDEAIVAFVRDQHNLLIGLRTAEDIKMTIGSATPGREGRFMASGRDLTTGLPNSVALSSDDVALALRGPLRQIIEAVREAIEDTPPELIADIFRRGITLAGGGALILGLDSLLSNETGMPVTIAEDPISAVVRGTGKALEDIGLLHKVQILSQELR